MDKETAALYAKLQVKLKEQASGQPRSEKGRKLNLALTNLEQSQLWYQAAHK